MTLTLQEISDRLEIQDLIVDYADVIDTCEIDRLDDIFTKGAYIDYSAMGGEKGDLEKIKDFLKAALPIFKNTQHLISNYQIKINGDTATGRIMCFNPMEINDEASGNPVLFLGLWYVDEYVRTEAGWRIKSRVEEKSYQFNTPETINAGD
jgi:hypothetical protein